MKRARGSLILKLFFFFTNYTAADASQHLALNCGLIWMMTQKNDRLLVNWRKLFKNTILIKKYYEHMKIN